MLKILTLIDEYARECLALRMERRSSSYRVIEKLGGCYAAARNPAAHSHNGPGVYLPAVAQVAGAFASLPLTIEPTSRMSIAKPLHGKLRAECLNGTIVYSLGDRKS
jgi:putative transposase